jgi:hypothetical protein
MDALDAKDARLEAEVATLQRPQLLRAQSGANEHE